MHLLHGVFQLMLADLVLEWRNAARCDGGLNLEHDA
jgi:hypothetical protein